MKSSLLVLASLLIIHTTWAADPPAEGVGAPTIKHAPVTTVVRGQPAHIAADIAAMPGATITSVVTFVRLTDVGTPVRYPMTRGSGDGVFATDIPVSLIRGVMRFWYHVHAEDSSGRIADTPWYPVNIVDGGELGGKAGGAGGWFTARNAAIAGGVALFGGGAALLLDDDDDNNDNPTTGGGAPTATNSPPRKSEPKDDDDNDHDNTPRVCVLTGAESATLVSGSDDPYDLGNPIQFIICGTCSNATVRVVGSWGEETTVAPFNNPSCSPDNPVPLTKPPATPYTADSETIQIFSNGSLIHSLTWPSAGALSGF
jgi:hypothetical protein